MKPINCPECGYLIQDNSTFCKMCGCKIDKKSETADENYSSPDTQPSGTGNQTEHSHGNETVNVNPAPSPSPNVQSFPSGGATPPYPGQFPVNGAAPRYNGNMPASMPASMPGSSMPVQYPGTFPGQYPGKYPAPYAPAGSRYPTYNPQRNKANSSGKKLWIILSSVIGGILLLAGITFSVVYFTVPDRKYNSACAALEAQRFDEAYDGFIALGSYKDSKDKASESMYKKGVYLNENKKYKEAADIFNKLGNYEDSFAQYQSSYYNYGLQLIGDGAYSEAIEVFTSLGSYSDSELMIDEAKYCYIVNHLDNSDATTYNYLIELKAVNYKDCKQLYNTLYAWKATKFYFNTGSDSTDKKTSISRSSPLYCHFTIEGGPPEGSFYAYASALWPDGSKKKKKKSAVVMYRNGTFWWGWKDGIYLDPKNGKTGTFILILYDDNNNEIGRSSVRITK